MKFDFVIIWSLIPIALIFFILLSIKVVYALYFLIKVEFLSNLTHKPTLLKLNIPEPDNTILFFFPHPDDETAGCCTLIKKCVEKGCKVKIVMLTNGDGVGLIDKLKFFIMRPKPDYFEKIAYIRQKETRSALSILGVAKEDMIFLGYPDRCSEYLWTTHWDSDKPYTSRYTKCNNAFYYNSYAPGKPYTGSQLNQLIERIIKEVNPTYIVYPHFYDCHVDHYITNNLIKYILCKLNLNVTELTYLIHRGNWPAPLGKFYKMQLYPPKVLDKCGINWYSLENTLEDIQIKERCLLTYKSQLKNPIMKIYLMSFLRKNELFGEYKDEVVKLNDLKTFGSHGVAVTISNPFTDTFLSYFNKAADIGDLIVTIDSEYLNILVQTRKEPEKHYKYIIELGFFNLINSACRFNIILHKGKLNFRKMNEKSRDEKSGNIKWGTAKSCIYMSIPINIIPEFKSMFVDVATYKGNITIDRTGIRTIKYGEIMQEEKVVGRFRSHALG